MLRKLGFNQFQITNRVRITTLGFLIFAALC